MHSMLVNNVSLQIHNLKAHCEYYSPFRIHRLGKQWKLGTFSLSLRSLLDVFGVIELVFS
jgi:hypothetical protein